MEQAVGVVTNVVVARNKELVACSGENSAKALKLLFIPAHINASHAAVNGF
jgi:hypothetical protein